MEEFFFSQQLDSRRALCIGPITRKEAANLSDSAAGISAAGLYMFIVDGPELDADMEIVARMESADAAARMANMLRAGKLEAAAGF